MKMMRGNRRWRMHSLACFALFVNYYLYDIPAAMYRPLESQFSGGEEKGFFDLKKIDFPFYLSLLYTLYSLCNVLLPLISGWLMDKEEELELKEFRSSLSGGSIADDAGKGDADANELLVNGKRRDSINVTVSQERGGFVRKKRLPWLLIFSALTMVGQGLFALGLYYHIYWLMALGRFTFGLGGESVGVATTRTISVWFKGKELGLALGIYLSLGRLGTVSNNLITPWLSVHYSTFHAGFVGFLLALGSMAATTLITRMEKSERDFYFESMAKDSDAGISEPDDEIAPLQEDGIPPVNADQNASWSLLLLSAWKSVKYEIKRMSDHVHRSFWTVCWVSFLLFGIMVPFNTMASDFLQVQGFNAQQAGYIMSIPDSMALLIVPILGDYVDRKGNALIFMMLSSIVCTLAHANLAAGNPPIQSFILLGLSYTGLFTIWTCIPKLVPSKYLTTAYGLATASCNLGFSIIPMVTALVLALSHKDYTKTELLISLLSGSGALCTFALQYDNVKDRLGLNEANSKVTAASIPDHASEETMSIQMTPNPSAMTKTLSKVASSEELSDFEKEKRHRDDDANHERSQFSASPSISRVQKFTKKS